MIGYIITHVCIRIGMPYYMCMAVCNDRIHYYTCMYKDRNSLLYNAIMVCTNKHNPETWLW